ncbi:MAG: hypothetical protein RRZ24_08125 [Clostridia bacterium]
MHVPTTGILTLDLHGKNIYQARISIDAILRRANKDVYRIRLIHGFHMGTSLRDMIRAEYAGHAKVLRLDATADSVTELVLREF